MSVGGSLSSSRETGADSFWILWRMTLTQMIVTSQAFFKFTVGLQQGYVLEPENSENLGCEDAQDFQTF